MIKLEFRNLLKEFLEASNTVEIEEDVIKNSDVISDDVKKELMATLAKNEKFAKKSTGIPQPLKVNHKKAIKETLEKNPVKVNSKKIIKEEDLER